MERGPRQLSDMVGLISVRWLLRELWPKERGCDFLLFTRFKISQLNSVQSWGSGAESFQFLSSSFWNSCVDFLMAGAKRPWREWMKSINCLFGLEKKKLLPLHSRHWSFCLLFFISFRIWLGSSPCDNYWASYAKEQRCDFLLFMWFRFSPQETKEILNLFCPIYFQMYPSTFWNRVR